MTTGVAIEGLRLAAIDTQRGALDHNRLQKMRTAVQEVVMDLSQCNDVKPSPAIMPIAGIDEADQISSQSTSLPVLHANELQGAWVSPTAVLFISGSSPLDEAATIILAQIFEKHGFGVKVQKHQGASAGKVFQLNEEGVALVCVSYIDVGDAPIRARATIRRVQQQIPNVAVLAGLWGPNKDESGAIREELKAKYYASSFTEAVSLCILGCKQMLGANGRPSIS